MNGAYCLSMVGLISLPSRSHRLPSGGGGASSAYSSFAIQRSSTRRAMALGILVAMGPKTRAFRETSVALAHSSTSKLDRASQRSTLGQRTRRRAAVRASRPTFRRRRLDRINRSKIKSRIDNETERPP